MDFDRDFGVNQVFVEDQYERWRQNPAAVDEEWQKYFARMHGLPRIEQEATPRDLYDRPANEFVMSFVGPVNRLGDAFIRPHDVELLLEPNGSTQEAMVQRLVHLGFEVRVELVRDDGEVLSAQLTREQVEALELLPGQIVYVRPTRQTVFQ